MALFGDKKTRIIQSKGLSEGPDMSGKPSSQPLLFQDGEPGWGGVVFSVFLSLCFLYGGAVSFHHLLSDGAKIGNVVGLVLGMGLGILFVMLAPDTRSMCRITIDNGVVRVDKRTPSKPWTLRLEAPYSAFREVRVILCTENAGMFAGVMEAFLIRKKRMRGRIVLFRYPLDRRAITSHSEGWRAAKSVSNELGIPITKKEIDDPGTW